MNQDNEDLGQIIERALGGRSQHWLAEQSGVGQATISRLIRGRHKPTPETLSAIGGVLGLDALHLMRLAGVPLPPAARQRDPSAEYIAQRLSELPADLREPIIEAVAAMVDAAYEVIAKMKASPHTPDTPIHPPE